MDWHFQSKRTGDRQGPVSAATIDAKISTGELVCDDVAWRVGLPAWAPLSTLPEFSGKFGSVSVAPSATTDGMSGATGPAPIGYYTPRGDAPARVKANLAKYAAPTGPTGEWPLSDAHLAQLAESVRYRKKILAAFSLARLAVFLTALGVAGMLVVAATLATNKRTTVVEWVTLGGVGGFYLILLALFWMASNAIKYCRAWGTLVMAIISTLGVVTGTGSVAVEVGNARSSDAVGLMLVAVLVFVIQGAIAYVFWRGWSATPKYLNSSVWCQEALAVSEQAK